MIAESLYFIAIVLPEHIQSKVIEIQTDVSNRFGSQAVLKVMPHITLKSPFKISSAERLKAIEWFKNMNLDIQSFDLELRNFGAFTNPKHPVIYIAPMTNPSLEILQKTILKNFIDAFPDIGLMSMELEFRPHVTIAYRDLKPEMFDKAWSEFIDRRFSENFKVGEIHLLQHDTKRWNIIQTCDLL